MRERLLADVQVRVKRFAAGQDTAVVLNPAALAEVAALLDAASDPTADLEVAHAAGWLHWCRYLVLDPGADQQDLSAALRLLAPVYRAQPDAVPDQVRAHFAADRPDLLGDPEAMAGRAVGLLQHALRAGGCGELDEAVDLLRQALDTSPADDPDRAGWLSNLGGALRTRFERTGRQTDLDEAVTAEPSSAVGSLTCRRPILSENTVWMWAGLLPGAINVMLQSLTGPDREAHAPAGCGSRPCGTGCARCPAGSFPRPRPDPAAR